MNPLLTKPATAAAISAPNGVSGSPATRPEREPVDALEALRHTEPAVRERVKKPWLPKLTIGLVVLGVLGAAYGMLQPLLFPPRLVRLADVEVVEASQQRARAITAAAGWIEADPYPVTVRPLVKGVVTRFTVVEGDAVKADETIVAVLRNPELENALTLAEAELAVAEADLVRAQAVLDVRRSVLEQRLPQRTDVKRLEGELAVAKAELESASAAQSEADSALARARIDLDAQDRLFAGGAQAPIARQTAQRRVAEAEAARLAKTSDHARAGAEVARIESLLTLAQEGRDDPRELAGVVTEQAAEVARLAALKQRARVGLEVARRNVEFLTVRAPADGRVLRLLSAPGSVAGPMEAMRSLPSEAEGTTSTGVYDAMVGGLLALYDPQHIQARIDVPLQDVGQVGIGTEVELTISGKTFHGVVSRVVDEANILKATLQVKVRILDPDPGVKPEMIAKARFLVKDAPATGGAAPAHARIPAGAVRGDAVYVFDPTGGGRARRVPVRVIETQGGMAEVEGALGLSTRVILDPVEDGEKVRDADASNESNQPAPAAKPHQHER